MIDREKVIEGLEYLITAYAFHGEDAECLGDALELLKRQRPMQVVMDEKDMLHYGRCPACFRILTPWRANYCSICGQAVKWDG